MIRMTNISLSERASADFHRARRNFKADPGEVFALLWVSSYTNADGTAVPGFEPAYMCGPLYLEGLASPWALAQIPDGSQFYFMPRFEWSDQEHYLIDKRGQLFSVTAATGR